MALSPRNASTSDHERDDRVGYLLDVVTNPDRRRLLEALSELPDEWIAVDALLRRAADSEDAPDGQFATAARYIHLPMLADLGVIDYRPDEGRVAHRRARVVDVLVTAARAFGRRGDGETVEADARGR